MLCLHRFQILLERIKWNAYCRRKGLGFYSSLLHSFHVTEQLTQMVWIVLLIFLYHLSKQTVQGWLQKWHLHLVAINLNPKHVVKGALNTTAEYPNQYLSTFKKGGVNSWTWQDKKWPVDAQKTMVNDYRILSTVNHNSIACKSPGWKHYLDQWNWSPSTN